ncbi:MAG TPA: GvpL/GvpF family gas vesicle protein [Solirubrobacterales bacterium]|jgi:hypothetical protein
MPKAKKTAAKYVYGVVRADDASSLKLTGINDEPVGPVTSDGLAALASDVPDELLEAGRDELLTHSRVLEQALENGTVLPMRFGVVLPDEQSVRDELLAPHSDELEAQLREMDGKVEINLKALHDEETILREVLTEIPEAAELRDSIQGKPEDATYYERIRLGEIIAQALDDKREQTGPAIIDRLSPYAVAVQVGDPAHERMALNASFLVERKDLERFDKAVDELGEEQGGRIRLRYTGPLPPHSFVELEMAA